MRERYMQRAKSLESTVAFRAPPTSIKQWRSKAKQSNMTLSQWLRRIADDGAVFVTTVTRREP